MKLVTDDFLENVALVYGDECKLRVFDLAKKADPNTSLQTLLEQAYKEAFTAQSDPCTAAIGKLQVT